MNPFSTLVARTPNSGGCRLGRELSLPEAVGLLSMTMQAFPAPVMQHSLGVFSLMVGISAAVPPRIRRSELPDFVGLLAVGSLMYSINRNRNRILLSIWRVTPSK